MRTSNYQGVRRIPFLFGLIVFSLLFSGCKNSEDISKPKRLSAIPISIQFLNADSSSDVEPQKVKVEMYDPKGNVFTPIGNQSSTYTIENGFLSLVMRNNNNPDNQKVNPIALPYRFTIKSTSNGYLKKTQTIVIDEYQEIYVPVFMMPLDEMPKGSSQAQASGILGDNAVTKEDIKVRTEPSPKSGENGITASLYIEPGTQLYGTCKEHDQVEGYKEYHKDRDCKVPITNPSDSVNIDFYQFDPRFDASANAFPNGFLVTDAVDNQGEILATLENSFFFSSLGYINLSMTVGTEEVMGFSKPITLEMEVPSDLTNPIIGTPIEENFQVPVWSLNATTGQWTIEDDLSLFKKDGRLFARFEMTHLSTWNLDKKVDACLATDPAVDPITININNTGQGFKARYADFYYTGTPMPLAPTNANNVILLQSHAVHTLEVLNAPIITGGTGLQFRLYNTVRPTSGIVHTENNIICEDTRIIDLSGVASDCVHFEIFIECEDFGNACFRPEMIGLWYEQGLVAPGANPTDIEHQEAHYAGMPKIGAIDIDMTDIKNMVGSGASSYRFLLQFNSTSSTATDTKSFDLRYDGMTGRWNNPGIDVSVKTFNQITPPSGSYCTQSYEILLEFDCGFNPGIHYPTACPGS